MKIAADAEKKNNFAITFVTAHIFFSYFCSYINANLNKLVLCSVTQKETL